MEDVVCRDWCLVLCGEYSVQLQEASHKGTGPASWFVASLGHLEISLKLGSVYHCTLMVTGKIIDL